MTSLSPSGTPLVQDVSIRVTRSNFHTYIGALSHEIVTNLDYCLLFTDSSDKTKSRAYLLKKKVLPRWDNSRGKKKPSTSDKTRKITTHITDILFTSK